MRNFLCLCVALVSLCAAARADLIKQSATYERVIYMQDSTQPRSPGVAGLTLTISQKKAGGTFAAITPTVTDQGGGWYSLALTAAMNDTLGPRAIKVTATGADETDVLDQIVAFDPTDAAALGLTTVTSTGANVSSLKSALTPTTGTIADGLSTTTVLDSGLTAPFADSYKGQQVVFTSGANAQTFGTISTNTTGANSKLTVLSAFGAAPASGDAFTLVIGHSKKQVDMLVALGSDNRPKVSADAHTAGATVAAVTAPVTVGTNNDKTGYALTQAFPANFASLGIGATGHITNVDTLTTYTGNTPQTGDAFARIGVNGAGLTALPNVTIGGYAAGQDPATQIFAGSFLTLPTTATISGVGETLTFKQWMALLDAMQGGDNVSTTPAASSTFTVTYYLRGAAHTSGNIVYVATVSLDASKNQTGRTGKVAQPFPAVN